MLCAVMIMQHAVHQVASANVVVAVHLTPENTPRDKAYNGYTTQLARKILKAS